jgi:hypothetical protein
LAPEVAIGAPIVVGLVTKKVGGGLATPLSISLPSTLISSSLTASFLPAPGQHLDFTLLQKESEDEAEEES